MNASTLQTLHTLLKQNFHFLEELSGTGRYLELRYHPANIRLNEDVLKLFWRCLSSSSSRFLDQDEYIGLNHTFSRHLQDVLERCLQDVFEIYYQVKLFLLTRLQEVFNTFLRRTAKTVIYRRICQVTLLRNLWSVYKICKSGCVFTLLLLLVAAHRGAFRTWSNLVYENVIDLETNHFFLIKPFSYMTKRSRQFLNIFRTKGDFNMTLDCAFKISQYWCLFLTNLQVFFYRTPTVAASGFSRQQILFFSRIWHLLLTVVPADIRNLKNTS